MSLVCLFLFVCFFFIFPSSFQSSAHSQSLLRLSLLSLLICFFISPPFPGPSHLPSSPTILSTLVCSFAPSLLSPLTPSPLLASHSQQSFLLIHTLPPT